MASKSSVFISYAEDTKPLAEQLTHALDQHGIESWVDFRNFRPGQRWREELDRAVESAQCFLILVSPESWTSGRQEAEWSAALARTWADPQKILLPVVFGPIETPPFLRDRVALYLNPADEPVVWGRQVLDALASARPAEAENTRGDVDRRERQERFDEIARAAQQLRFGQPETPRYRLKCIPSRWPARASERAS